jgi:hypothetical protein
VASKSLSFLLFGEDVTASKAFAKVAKSAEVADGQIKKAFGGGSLLAIGALAGGLGLAVKGAADYQTAMTRLVTAGGESEKNLALVSKGVMAVSSATGTGLHAAGDAMYYIESAGFHGAKGLAVLKAAAQGAKVEGADTKVVADALTTALTDLGKHAGPPAVVMSQLVETVAHGKLTMDALAGSLHSVLPNASAIGISFGQVAGAIATMTAQGISADQATQNLNHAILSLANPTAVQTKAMAAFGLNASVVAKNLGKQGLTGTLEELTNTITSHMGPAGLTITNSLNTSKIAADKVSEGYKAMVPAAQKYFDALVSGKTISQSTIDGTKGLTLAQDTQIKQLVVLYKRASGFSDLLKSGNPDALTYAAALSKMTGGATGLQVALHLTGDNLETFKKNVTDVSKTTADAGGNVKDFAVQQQTLNGKLADLKVSASNMAVTFGTQLIPALTSAADFTLKHKTAIEALVGSLLAMKVGMMGVSFTMGAIATAQTVWAASTAVITAGVSGLETAYVAAMYAMEVATGPVGIAIGVAAAAIAIGTKGFGLFGGSAHAQIKPVQALTDAITADGDAVGKLTTAQLNNTLQSKGAYDAGIKLGLSQRTILQAALGNAAAQKEVRAATDAATNAVKNATSADHIHRSGIGDVTKAQKDAKAAADLLNGSVNTLTGQLGASKHAADNVAAALRGIPKSITPRIALLNAQTVEAQIDYLTRSRSIQVSLQSQNSNTKLAAQLANSPLHPATGGLLIGPGSGTSDSIPAMVSNGEYVVNAAATAKFRPFLDAINGSGVHRAPGYATGGAVGVSGGNQSRFVTNWQNASRGGGDVYITVNAGLGTNGPAVGKQIAAELERYVGGGGKVKIARGVN